MVIAEIVRNGILYMMTVLIITIKTIKIMIDNNTTEEQMVLDQIENMSNEVLANVVSNKLKYEFAKAYLVKQMEPITIKKTVKMPVPITDDVVEVAGEDTDITDRMPEMTMEDKEIELESVFRAGYIIKVPTSLKDAEFKYNVGDKIIYRTMRATEFDLVPGSALIEPFDVICKEVE